MMGRLRSEEVRKGTGYLVDPQTIELGHWYMGLYKKRNMKHVCWNDEMYKTETQEYAMTGGESLKKIRQLQAWR